MNRQFSVLLASVVLGFLMGMVLERYWRLTRRWRRHQVIVADAALWAVLSALVFLVLLYLNRAEIRFAVFLGIGLGTLTYCRIIKKFLWGRSREGK